MKYKFEEFKIQAFASKLNKILCFNTIFVTLFTDIFIKLV